MKGVFCASKPFVCSLLLLLCLAVSSGPASAVLPYTITDLGTVGDSRSHAYGTNASAQVVGLYNDGDDHAFLWLPEPAYGMSAGMHSLGSLGGSGSAAYRINESGQVVGWADLAGGQFHAFLWLPEEAYEMSAGMHPLGSFGGAFSEALDINESGQVAGYAATPSGYGYYHAFLWEAETGVMQDLGTLGGTKSYGLGINASGQTTGYAHTESDDFHAFLITPEGGVWYRDDNGDGRNDLMLDLGTLGGSESVAWRMNELGQVVGWANIESGDRRAFLWHDDNGNGESDPGEMQDLGTLVAPHSEAFAINALAQVVGYTYIGPNQPDVAFLWENGVMYDLNTLICDGSGWDLVNAADINDAGQIVGWGYHDGEARAYLLTPIPEPSVVGLLVFGAVGLLVRRRRKN